MDDNVRIVQQYYDSDVQMEWDRLETHPFEFRITTHMMDKYIKPGDRILDIGGGPGRYSIYYAKKGCDVTLVDLSSENAKYALEKSKEMGVSIKAISGDARDVNKLVEGKFDHIFVMGPMYHLLEEEDRMKALNSAISLMNDGGMIYISFILLFAGMIYGMKYMPEFLPMENEQIFIDAVLKDKSFRGDAFTKAFFISQKDILPFMNKFPLERKHLFGQESILAPGETNILNQPQEVVDKWIEVAEGLCEREELLSYSEHAMYIGQKRNMNHLGTVLLETKRLILRPFKQSDVDDMYNNWASNDNVSKFLTWPTHESKEITKSVIDMWVSKYQELQNYHWCIEWKENHQAIGSLGVVHFNENIEEVEIGYCIGEAYWHKGITTEAFEEVIRFLFEEVHCNRIMAKHDVNNPNSGKVMRKAGLEYEETLLQTGRNNTGICDLAVYAITKGRYLNRQD